MHVLVFHEACVHQFAALFTIAAEAVFHIHVVDTQNKFPNNVPTDYPFHSSVAPSVPLLSCFCLPSHSKHALQFLVWSWSSIYSVAWVP